MAVCKNCGCEIQDGSAFCSACGARVENYHQQTNYDPGFNAPPQYTPEYGNAQGEEFTQDDIENNKVISLFSYIGILFLVPLLAAKDSKYARFHVNQGLVLFLANTVLGVAAVIPFGRIVSAAGYVFTVVCAVIGIINALQGNAKELPLIGKFRILK
ncbi:MAG: zinc-ribbon domain-containing protein [Acutalibacteraceae bacterium]